MSLTFKRKSKNQTSLGGCSHPKGDDDEEHPEENSENLVAGKGEGHDADEGRRGSHHDRRADLPESVRYP